MGANELLKAGQLDEAIETLTAELREQPTDVKRRTFLFELLCFAGAYDRAEKQLDALARESSQAEIGALLYRSALSAERTRQAMFEKGEFPSGKSPSIVSGEINGRPFQSMTDADPRIGARLEVFAGGQYTWIPFDHLESVRIAPPKRLRDLLWATAIVRPRRGAKSLELGEMLIPALAPLSWQHEEDTVRLGRITDWQTVGDDLQVPIGQKMFIVDDEEIQLLEVRELTFAPVGSDA